MGWRMEEWLVTTSSWQPLSWILPNFSLTLSSYLTQHLLTWVLQLTIKIYCNDWSTFNIAIIPGYDENNFTDSMSDMIVWNKYYWWIPWVRVERYRGGGKELHVQICIFMSCNTSSIFIALKVELSQSEKWIMCSVFMRDFSQFIWIQTNEEGYVSYNVIHHINIKYCFLR